MFEWSKEICDKIAQSGCISDKDLQCVEMALRMYDINNAMLNESIGLVNQDDFDFFELRYQVNKNAQIG